MAVWLRYMGPALSSLKPVWMDPTTTKKCPGESFKETTRNTSDSFMILYKKLEFQSPMGPLF